MRRRVYEKLLAWKASGRRKPLILSGARQVGKTWLLREFGSREYANVAYFSCDRESAVVKVFEGDYDVRRILRQLSALSGVDIEGGRTLVVLDEIQASPRALSALKYFCEDAPEIHVAVAGSLLGVSLHENVSFPVGKVDMIRVYPMSFVEFLEATGHEEMARMVDEGAHELMTGIFDSYVELLRQYYYVGGMPGVVSLYVDGGGPVAVREMQKQILFDYGRDFSKHAPAGQVARINMVWESIPGQLFRENKKFRYADVKKGGRASEFELALQWLQDMGLVHKVTRVREVRMPLKVYEESGVFKLYMLDCGLLGALVDAPARELLIGDNGFTEFRGGLTEQYVLEQLVSRGDTVYYHSTDDSRLEMDFVIQGESGIVPIEVKAGRNVRSNSLSMFLGKHPEMRAVRYSLLPYKEQEGLVNVPLFAIGEKR